jgi:hypothetical protein
MSEEKHFFVPKSGSALSCLFEDEKEYTGLFVLAQQKPLEREQLDRCDDLEMKLDLVNYRDLRPFFSAKAAMICELPATALRDLYAAFFFDVLWGGEPWDTPIPWKPEHSRDVAVKAGGLVDLAPLVSGMLDALHSQRMDSSRRFEFLSTKTLHVNIGPKRNNTRVQLFVAMLVNWVNKCFADHLVHIVVSTDQTHLASDEARANTTQFDTVLRKLRIPTCKIAEGLVAQRNIGETIRKGGCLIARGDEELLVICKALNNYMQTDNPVAPAVVLTADSGSNGRFVDLVSGNEKGDGVSLPVSPLIVRLDDLP